MLRILPGMFISCINLTSLPDISNWIVGSVTDFTGLFGICLSLISISNLSKWDLSSAI